MKTKVVPLKEEPLRRVRQICMIRYRAYMNKLMRRYWLDINGLNFCPNLGITGYGEEDIKLLISQKIGESVEIKTVKLIHSLDELDQKHVVPNMEEFISRGIWYPKGFK
jgi:hypothetical protein